MNFYTLEELREAYNDDVNKGDFYISSEGHNLLSKQGFELFFFGFFGDRMLTTNKTVAPDVAYSKLKTMWSYYKATRLADWVKMYNAYNTDYDPLYNKDAYIEHSTVKSGNEVDAGTKSAQTNVDTAQTAPFNSEDFKNDEKTTRQIGGSSSGNTHTYNDVTETYTAREYGNIGVTTSQQMLQSELGLRAFNLEQYIVTEFVNHFTFY